MFSSKRARVKKALGATKFFVRGAASRVFYAGWFKNPLALLLAKQNGANRCFRQ